MPHPQPLQNIGSLPSHSAMFQRLQRNYASWFTLSLLCPYLLVVSRHRAMTLEASVSGPPQTPGRRGPGHLGRVACGSSSLRNIYLASASASPEACGNSSRLPLPSGEPISFSILPSHALPYMIPLLPGPLSTLCPLPSCVPQNSCKLKEWC